MGYQKRSLNVVKNIEIIPLRYDMIDNRLKKWYNNILLEDILSKNPYWKPKNMDLNPKLVINTGSKNVVLKTPNLVPILLTFQLITGQKGKPTKAKNSLAGYRLRKGMYMGLKINLQKYLAWNFLDKFEHVLLPNLKFFNKLKVLEESHLCVPGPGLGGVYDNFGNYSIGLNFFDKFWEIRELRESRHGILNHFSFYGGDFIIIYGTYNKKILLENPTYFLNSELKKNS